MALNNVLLGWTEGNEATARTASASAPIIVGDDPYTQISSETYTLEGYSELPDFSIFTGAASRTLRINITAQRGESGRWNVTITRNTYKANSELLAEEEQEFPEGESEEYPSYQCSESRADVPLTLHPRYASLFANPSAPVALALAALYNGALGGELVADPNNEGSYLGTADAIIATDGSAEAVELAAKLQRGQKSYVGVQTVLTCSFKTATYNMQRSSKMKKIATPPGPYQTPTGCNWLCVGVDTQPLIAEGCYSVSEKYLLSDEGGWDPDIYATA